MKFYRIRAWKNEEVIRELWVRNLELKDEFYNRFVSDMEGKTDEITTDWIEE